MDNHKRKRHETIGLYNDLADSFGIDKKPKYRNNIPDLINGGCSESKKITKIGR